jgi:hypothetical protein
MQPWRLVAVNASRHSRSFSGSQTRCVVRRQSYSLESLWNGVRIQLIAAAASPVRRIPRAHTASVTTTTQGTSVSNCELTPLSTTLRVL